MIHRPIDPASHTGPNRHGRVVSCVYGDDKFKACVFSEHRGQVIHQAAITGFDHGVYISAKLEEGKGSIVQVVIFKIPDSVKENHLTELLVLAEPLLPLHKFFG